LEKRLFKNKRPRAGLQKFVAFLPFFLGFAFHHLFSLIIVINGSSNRENAISSESLVTVKAAEGGVKSRQIRRPFHPDVQFPPKSSHEDID
jgi:hypothetical protein